MPVKQCLEGSLEILNVYVRKEDGFQINNQSFHLKKLGEKNKSKLNPKQAKGGKQIIIKISMSCMENRKTIDKNQ